MIEDTGLIKMDFLGLKTLSIIKDAIENIRQTKGIEVDIDDFSIINDPATYKLYSEDVPSARSSSSLPACRNTSASCSPRLSRT